MKKTMHFILALLPYIVIMVVSYFLYQKLSPIVTVPNHEFVLNSLITCAATFSGFTLTIVSILAGFLSSPLMQYIIKNGGMTELRVRYTSSLLLGVILIVFCIIVGGTANDKNEFARFVIATGSTLSLSYLFSMLSSGWYLLQAIANAPRTDNLQQGDGKPQVPEGKYRL